MKIILIIVSVVALIIVSGPVFAREAGEKGASSEAYERASQQSMFNRVSDWFATIGRSGEEKEKLLEERRMKRSSRRAQKEAQKARIKVEKKVKTITKQKHKGIYTPEVDVHQEIQEKKKEINQNAGFTGKDPGKIPQESNSQK